MRILLITGSLPPVKCGVGDYTARLAGTLAAVPGLEVGIITGPGAMDVPGVKLLAPPASWEWAELDTILATVAGFAPDIAHIQYPTTGYGRHTMPYWIPRALTRRGVCVVQTWHEPLRWRSLLWYLPAALTAGGLVVAEPDFRERAAAWVSSMPAMKRMRFIPVGSSIPRCQLDDAERAAIRSRYCPAGERMIAYFGFASPAKRIEVLLDVADPLRDRLVLLCDLDEGDPYHKELLTALNGGVWRGRTTVTGFLPAGEVGKVLAAADATVLPFADGVAFRNTSFLAARAQGTFVLTTSRSRHGYVEDENVFYARPDDVAGMKAALARYVGMRAPVTSGDEWQGIAEQHREYYQTILEG